MILKPLMQYPRSLSSNNEHFLNLETLCNLWGTSFEGLLFPESFRAKLCSLSVCIKWRLLGLRSLQVVLVNTVKEYIDRHSVHMSAKYRPSIGQLLTNIQPIYIGWQYILANSQSSVGWVSIEVNWGVSWVSVGYQSRCWQICLLVKCWSSDSQHIAQYLADARPILDRHSTDTQPILDWLSADISAVYWPSGDRCLANALTEYCSIYQSADTTHSKHDTNALGVCKMRNNKWYTISWVFVRLRAGGGAAPTLNSRYNGGRKSSLQLSSDDSEEETSFQYKHQNIKRGSNGAC